MPKYRLYIKFDINTDPVEQRYYHVRNLIKAKFGAVGAMNFGQIFENLHDWPLVQVIYFGAAENIPLEVLQAVKLGDGISTTIQQIE
ncbi:uncharacterized protein ASPGLDRAFT_55082 [Aspergillus glaucus CBS 516.65]|uniref:Uncharacterized protein n=1 Tax=Aspergillus glaucus CBS 516.65 TaxID=1160497 RepID=A0A1L9VV39_ASPGL|nr:hypothetical protein ASPGLDRAFT_55082 [Aspergillus glaucus CBS 516.65]OJJ87769.1 hypothetical protein ASPGLDRAFT_55082 [Aspergillus glaucus CBS 516.65]